MVSQNRPPCRHVIVAHISITMRNRLDILVNILLPLLAGVLVYIGPAVAGNHMIVTNHLADGLWAYAFMSAMLITWERVANRPWITTVFLSALLFEWLQYLHVFPGTGDTYDVITYFLFFAAALWLNKFFRISLKPIS